MDAKTSGITNTGTGNKIYTEENKRALKKKKVCSVPVVMTIISA